MVNYEVGEEVGIKSVILLIKGYNVYGYLYFEKGVYWLVWILLFDLVVWCYIFFVLVDVMLILDELIEVEIDLFDLWVDIFCVFGVGG